MPRKYRTPAERVADAKAEAERIEAAEIKKIEAMKKKDEELDALIRQNIEALGYEYDEFWEKVKAGNEKFSSTNLDEV